MTKLIFLGGYISAFFSVSAPAQKVQWIKPSLIGVPPARCCAAMVYDPAMGATLLFGGDTNSTLFGDTWAFSKATGWRQLTPASSPPPLAGASLAYDPKTGTVVLFGGTHTLIGEGGTDSNETWLWDGVTWTQQFPPVSPPVRSWNATNGMVFDSLVGNVVLFGGYNNNNNNFIYMNDTWEWDGTTRTWTQKFPAHSPSPRTATLAYDETAKQVVLFGGWTGGFLFFDDTWTYNGVDWVQHQTMTTPPARADNALSFDPRLKRVVMFGGLAGACEICGEPRLNDTWVWGGVNWTQVQTPLTPAPSSGTSFSYDASVNGMLLFGGWLNDFEFTNTTWFFWLF